MSVKRVFRCISVTDATHKCWSENLKFEKNELSDFYEAFENNNTVHYFPFDTWLHQLEPNCVKNWYEPTHE